MSTPALQIPQSTLQWLWRAVTYTEHGPSQTYMDPTRTYSDVCHALAYNRGLSIRTDVYTHEDGSSALLLCLLGTIPVSFRGAAYSCPITIWVPFSYPHEGPMIYVTPPPPPASHATNPTAGMVVRPGQHVSVEGKVYHPYLSRWQDSSSLLEMLSILCDVFSKEPPVVFRPTIDPASRRPDIHLPATPPVPPRPDSHTSATLTPKSPPKVFSDEVPPPRPPRPDLHPIMNPSQHPAQGPIVAADDPPLPPPRPDLSSSSPSPAAPPRPPFSDYTAPPPAPPPKPFRSPMTTASYEPVQLGIPKSLAETTHPPPTVAPNSLRSDLPYPIPGQAGSSQFHVPSIPTVAPVLQHHETRPLSATSSTNKHTIQAPIYSPTPSKPAAHVSNLLDTVSDTDLPTTTPQLASPPPLPPNPHKDTLIHNISQALGRHLQASISQNTSGIAKLQSQAAAIHTASAKLSDEIVQLNELNSTIASNVDILRTEIARADHVISDTKLRSKSPIESRTQSPVSISVRSPPPSISTPPISGGNVQTCPSLPHVDDLLVPPTVVSKQLYDLVADERAIQRAIYALQSALVKGRIDIDVWSRTTRGLAREAFLKRALVVKAAAGAGLEFE